MRPKRDVGGENMGDKNVTVKFSEIPSGEKFTCLFVTYRKVRKNYGMAGSGDGLKKRRFDPDCQCRIARHRFDKLGLKEEKTWHANGPYPEDAVGKSNDPNIAMMMMDQQGEFIYVWRFRPPVYSPNEHWAGSDYKPRFDNHLMEVSLRVKSKTFTDGRKSGVIPAGTTWKQRFGEIPEWLTRGRVFLVRYEPLSSEMPERILEDPICTCA
jgi:hypothetical protein